VRQALALVSVRAKMARAGVLAARGRASVALIASARVALAARAGFRRKFAAVGVNAQARFNAVGLARVVRRAIVPVVAGAGAVECAPATSKRRSTYSFFCFLF
jgi:hypothetical protein